MIVVAVPLLIAAVLALAIVMYLDAWTKAEQSRRQQWAVTYRRVGEYQPLPYPVEDETVKPVPFEDNPFNLPLLDANLTEYREAAYMRRDGSPSALWEQSLTTDELRKQCSCEEDQTW